eukprot:3922441-Amphidinium_carterae.1
MQHVHSWVLIATPLQWLQDLIFRSKLATALERGLLLKALAGQLSDKDLQLVQPDLSNLPTSHSLPYQNERTPSENHAAPKFSK